MGRKHPGVNRRLSKPRLDRNVSAEDDDVSDNQTPPSSAPSGVSTVDYFADVVVVTSQGDRRSRTKSRSKLRDYLYGTPPSLRSSSPTYSSDGEDESPSSKRVSNMARNARKRLSRSGSAFTLISSAKTSSTQITDPARSQLAAEMEGSAAMADQIKERAQNDSMIADTMTSPTEQHDTDHTLLIPVRRKSLYTPGIATRSTSDILRKPPPPQTFSKTISQEERDYFYNPAYPTSSPLSQLASLDVSNEGRCTPCNLNIPQLGGLELGCLRITNGAASPAPPSIIAVQLRTPTPSLNVADEYHTASEGGDEHGRISPLSSLDALSLTSGAWMASGPPKPQLESHSRELDLTREYSTRVSPGQSGSAVDLANSYIAELDLSSLSGSSRIASPALGNDQTMQQYETQSNPEPEAPAMHAPKVNHDQEREIASAGAREKQTEDRRDEHRPSLQPSMCSASSGVSEMALNHDSGYGSTSSFDSRIIEQAKSAYAEVESIPIEYTDPTTMAQGDREVKPSSYPEAPSNAQFGRFLASADEAYPQRPHEYAIRQDVFASSSSSPPNRISRFGAGGRLRKPRPLSCPPPLLDTVTANHHELDGADIPRVPSIMVRKHAQRLTQFPLLEHTFPSSEHVSARRSPSPTKTVAYVPVRFPSPTGANTKQPAKRRSIFWSHSADNVTGSGGKISKTSSDEEGGKGRGRSWTSLVQGRDSSKPRPEANHVQNGNTSVDQTVKSELQETPNEKAAPERTTGNRRRSWGRSRSHEHTADQSEYVSIADLGSVAHSLGTGPYDAIGSMYAHPAPTADRRHPHQIGSSPRRSRVYAEMNDFAASECSSTRTRITRQMYEHDTLDRLEGRRRPNSHFQSIQTTLDLPTMKFEQAPAAYKRNTWESIRESMSQGSSGVSQSGQMRRGRPTSKIESTPPMPSPPKTGSSQNRIPRKRVGSGASPSKSASRPASMVSHTDRGRKGSAVSHESREFGIDLSDVPMVAAR